MRQEQLPVDGGQSDAQAKQSYIAYQKGVHCRTYEGKDFVTCKEKAELPLFPLGDEWDNMPPACVEGKDEKE